MVFCWIHFRVCWCWWLWCLWCRNACSYHCAQVHVWFPQMPPLALCHLSGCVDLLWFNDSGLWHAHRRQHHAHLLRSLVKLIETLFHSRCIFQFIPSHTGDPGNELVDIIAGQASLGFPLHDWSPFFGTVLQKDFIRTSEWLWILFDPQWIPHRCQTALLFPVKPLTTPEATCLPLSSPNITKRTQYHMQIRMLSCNVLTLKATPAKISDTGLDGPSRLESVITQLHETHVTIFALQETRLRRRVGHFPSLPRSSFWEARNWEAQFWGWQLCFEASEVWALEAPF